MYKELTIKDVKKDNIYCLALDLAAESLYQSLFVESIFYVFIMLAHDLTPSEIFGEEVYRFVKDWYNAIYPELQITENQKRYVFEFSKGVIVQMFNALPPTATHKENKPPDHDDFIRETIMYVFLALQKFDKLFKENEGEIDEKINFEEEKKINNG